MTTVDRLAEIGSAFVDGEDLKQIITEESMHYILNPDPEHRFLAMDHYVVEHAPFLRVKKILIRLARLAGMPLGAAVWIRVPGRDQVTPCVLNGTQQRLYTFGLQVLDTPECMKTVLDEGVRVSLPADENFKVATALAPVRDSLDDIVGVLELNAPTEDDSVSWA
jgi:hypothetical protein